MKNPLDELINGAELARRLGLSRERIRQLAGGDGFPAPLGRVGNTVVWRWADVDRWLQPELVLENAGIVFRTIPHRPGYLEVDERDGRIRGAVAWPGARIIELKHDPSGVRVRTSRSTGVITKNPKGSWTLSPPRD